MSRIRVGVIGTSWWSENMYLASLARHPAAQLVALCGRNQQHAREVARTYGIPRVFADHQELMRDGTLDAAIICTPDDLHFPMTMCALDAGVHVLCEKPLASNSTEAAQMYLKAQERQVRHMVLFTWRWLPHIRYLNDLVRGGYIGRPLQAQFAFQGDYAASDQYMWRFDARRANGIVGDLGSHMIDLALLLMGDVREVDARLDAVMPRNDPDGKPVPPANDTASLILGMEGGAQATVQVSAITAMGGGMRLQTTLAGSEGTIEATYTFNGQGSVLMFRGVRQGDPALRTLEVPKSYGDPQASIFELFAEQSVGPRAFIDAILQYQKAEPGFDVGLKVQRIIDAALKSQATGRRVRPSEV
ncbi:Gfo/Idh/MocA family protein [Deinococcus yavapaiensis]|uniref:Putative dehydrogenase n=1 Tax=Deinococcus yavapaiensis KR-236 TaxID=694435 RepID=A0A318S9W4_9DEIO|nr:Gfo/Idh/MocA family oxidoreductase [Deinococcus yavapaiensis]PYE55028.1 putative dehydrogenase [Deinococcus yavapaiensis KR-236]